MKPFAFLQLKHAVIILRCALAVVFLAHAVVRVANGTINQFGVFLESKRLPAGNALVWLITIFEIGGSLLLAAGYFTRWLSLFFIVLLLAGIILIHFQLGWFVGEHGDGGMEYSFILIAAFLVVAAGSSKKPGLQSSKAA
jgi:putative oxidoreductase